VQAGYEPIAIGGAGRYRIALRPHASGRRQT